MTLKVVYVKVKDPIAWKKSDVEWFKDDIVHMRCNVLRNAGILLHEDEKRIVLGELSFAEDNPELDDLGVKFPRYRDIMIIAKENILDRQDFEIKEETTSE